MKYFILIKADHNDADYVMNMNPITQEQIEEIQPMIKALEKRNGDYRTGECASQGKYADEIYKDVLGFELFNEFVPYAEYGIHTIESIEIIKIVNKLY